MPIDNLNIEITQAVLPDLENLHMADQRAFPNSPYPLFVLRQFHDLFPELFLIAEESGQTLGYVLGGIGTDGHGWVLSLAVVPDHRSQGIGRALMDALLDQFRKRGMKTILLTVSPTNTNGMSLYRKIGFVDMGIQNDYYGDGDERLLMSLEF